jgi:hypothetical protein
VFGAFTSLTQRSVVPKGFYDNCWFNEESSDGGCGFI